MHPSIPETSVEISKATGTSANTIAGVMSDVERHLMKLPPDARRPTALKLLGQYEADLKRIEAEKAEAERKLAGMESLKEWAEADHPLVLERNDTSRFHKLVEAGLSGRVIAEEGARILTGQPLVDTMSIDLSIYKNIFVVRHDWASAFKGAEGLSDDIRMPFDLCVFEFRLAGRTFIITVADDDGQPVACDFTEIGDYWYVLDHMFARENRIYRFLWEQIQAICIALDAEVATTSVVRAPVKLNEKRARTGRAPLRDFHMVDLAKRHRIANPAGGTNGTKKRLHFRRGHWRHYAESKTWIKWCLVGNPDLGFINKNYAL